MTRMMMNTSKGKKRIELLEGQDSIELVEAWIAGALPATIPLALQTVKTNDGRISHAFLMHLHMIARVLLYSMPQRSDVRPLQIGGFVWKNGRLPKPEEFVQLRYDPFSWMRLHQERTVSGLMTFTFTTKVGFQ